MAKIFDTKEEKPINEELTVYEKWEEYDLKDNLLKGIYSIGFDTPSFIQKTAIKPMLDGRDLRAQAQSGTGKTGAFTIGALQHVREDIKATQVLVLVSTRELAEQNAATIKTIGKHMDVDVCVLLGGTNYKLNEAELANKPAIVVGTPGRVFHMIESQYLQTDDISLLIIDEADEMLKSSFQDQVKKIFLTLPQEKLQIAMFSATWEEEELKIAAEILKDPVEIDLRLDEQTLKGIEQHFVCLGDKPRDGGDILKMEALIDIFNSFGVGQSVIFVNSKMKARFLHEQVSNRGFPADVIHGDLTLEQRSNVLRRFKDGTCRCLIATGIIGRGIDIQQLSMVFNFDIPSEDERSVYIHRIGRAGRYGRRGKAVNIVFNEEMPNLKAIEKHFSTSITPLPKDFSAVNN
ncbi:ATP-dependent RNA helicase eIF4A [Astathelohania contejeani]|uniref:RNA helicase n=1 Tax=Astathelohania contejeani TaxID=164912 RepID=A0ABQ7HW77_9MICR|nr:ATP-dependent RNA helicase eIF4A [Thelohania contejeani]